MSEIKLTRTIKLPKKDETLRVELTADHDNFIHYLDLMEQRVQDVYNFFEGKVKAPKIPPKTEKKSTDSEEKEEPKKVTKFSYVVIEDTVHFSVPYKDKDTFKEVVKEIAGRWPKWNIAKKTWELPDNLLSMKLDEALLEALGGPSE